MDNTQVEIALNEEISLLLSVTDKNGNPIAGASISSVIWSDDNAIGIITADPGNPNKATFVPSKPGVVNIKATATVIIP